MSPNVTNQQKQEMLEALRQQNKHRKNMEPRTRTTSASDQYLSWNTLRWIFPIIFVGILSSHVYVYIFPQRPKPLEKVAPDPNTEDPVAVDFNHAVVESALDEENVIDKEFKRLCEELLKQAIEENRIPPDRLSEALRAVKQQWKHRSENFETTFRFLQKRSDPWGRPYLYRVDRETRTISLKSLGRNKVDDRSNGDDIVVSRNYHLRDEK